MTAEEPGRGARPGYADPRRRGWRKRWRRRRRGPLRWDGRDQAQRCRDKAAGFRNRTLGAPTIGRRRDHAYAGIRSLDGEHHGPTVGGRQRGQLFAESIQGAIPRGGHISAHDQPAAGLLRTRVAFGDDRKRHRAGGQDSHQMGRLHERGSLVRSTRADGTRKVSPRLQRLDCLRDGRNASGACSDDLAHRWRRRSRLSSSVDEDQRGGRTSIRTRGLDVAHAVSPLDVPRAPARSSTRPPGTRWRPRRAAASFAGPAFPWGPGPALRPTCVGVLHAVPARSRGSQRLARAARALTRMVRHER